MLYDYDRPVLSRLPSSQLFSGVLSNATIMRVIDAINRDYPLEEQRLTPLDFIQYYNMRVATDLSRRCTGPIPTTDQRVAAYATPAPPGGATAAPITGPHARNLDSSFTSAGAGASSAAAAIS